MNPRMTGGTGQARSGRRAATRARAGGPDRGSGTVWSVALIAVVASLALLAAAIGGAVVTRHRAGAAADLSALAAADAVARAAGQPCLLAERVAERYGGVLTSCVVNGMVVDVVVSMVAGGLLGGERTASVRARAGPA